MRIKLKVRIVVLILAACQFVLVAVWTRAALTVPAPSRSIASEYLFEEQIRSDDPRYWYYTCNVRVSVSTIAPQSGSLRTEILGKALFPGVVVRQVTTQAATFSARPIDGGNEVAVAPVSVPIRFSDFKQVKSSLPDVYPELEEKSVALPVSIQAVKYTDHDIVCIMCAVLLSLLILTDIALGLKYVLFMR